MGIAASFGGHSLQSCGHQKSGGSNALKQGRVCRGAEIRPPARTPKATRMAREPSGQEELKSSAMIALLDAVSWFFQASHWATSRAEIASVKSGIKTLCAISVSVPFYSFRSQFSEPPRQY